LATTKRRKAKGKGARPDRRPRLSVCLIARDEAACLDRCLGSVAGLADEIVLVDTGSTDDTVAIARRHGARVISFRWTEDFSAARNRGLEAARGRWIFSLDADEALASGDRAALVAAMEADDVDGYRLTTRNYTTQQDRSGFVAADDAPEAAGQVGWFPTTKVRLFRRRREFRFRGQVHELVDPSILEAGGRLADCQVPVHHYGLVEKDRADDRYLAAGERKVAAAPDDLRARFELAVAYRDGERLADGLQQIETVVAGLDAGGQALYLEEEKARLVHGDLLDRLGRLDEALAVYRDVIERFPDSFQAYNNAGSLLGRLQRLEEAHQAYRRGADLAPDNEVIRRNLAQLEAKLASVGSVSTAPGVGASLPVPNPGDGLGEGHPISLCIIVRDGAEDLERCLTSVRGAVDEIVVVDTGSSDDSVGVARRHGARVEHVAWIDDFAAARNASLDYATGEWILWMDADDYLLPEDRDRVQRARQLAPEVALSFTLVNTGGADTSRFRQVKMFPNRPDVRFRRPVHETVLPDLERAGIPVKTTDVSVMHTVYADPDVVRRKAERYRRLMEGWLAEHPDDLDVCFRLGHTAYSEGRRDEALTWFERVLAAGESVQPRSLRRHALVFRGRCRLEAGDWAASIPDFEAALALDAKDVFARVSLGDALTKAGRSEEAVRHLRQGLGGTLDGTFPLERDVLDYTAHYFLGENLSRLGRIDEAVAAFEAAQRAQPQRSEATQALRQLRLSRGAGEPAAAGGTQAFSPPAPVHGDARLTLCMIVRDEEARLGECLESAKAAVDEIVVVDTGSTDGTIDVARQHGARIGHFEWCDDFSAARNVSLELATGDWILWLDADDRLPAEYVDTIRQLIAGPRDRGYFFVLDDRGYESVSCLQMRLFPNVPGVAFEMPIHEQVTPSLARLGIDMVPTPVRVVHTGYTTPEVVSAKKERYLGIMERWLESHPEDYIVRSHVALTYHTTGRWQEAAEQYRRIVEESACREDRNFVILTTSLLFLGRTWQKLGDLDRALAWLRQAEEVDGDYVLLQHTLADVLLDRGEAAEAVRYAQKVLQRDQQQLTFFPIDQNELRYSTLHILGRAQAVLDQVDEAATSLQEASTVPVARASDALGSLSDIYKEAGRRADAVAVLDRALAMAPDHPRHLFNAGMLQLEAGEAEAARERFERVLAVVGPEPTDARLRALLNLGFLAKSAGDVDTAERRYLEVLDLAEDHVDAKANLGHLYRQADRPAEALARFDEVLAAQPGLLDIELGRLCVQLTLGEWDAARGAALFAAVPEAGEPPGGGTPAQGDLRAEEGDAFLRLGIALVRRNLSNCADMALQISLTRSPEGASAAQAHRCLAEICFNQGRLWDAVSHLETVLRTAPEDTDAFRRLGDTYARLGVDDAARLCYERAGA
jgi:glycosyltransferase involved in cell wall biosynthesis/Tfp pilus assembly protein PilF